MDRRELIEMLRHLHDVSSLAALVEALVVLCHLRADQERDHNNDADARRLEHLALLLATADVFGL
jgi:hypothetical protein